MLNTFVPPPPGHPARHRRSISGKLNGALGPLATALLGGGKDIESLKIGFDPQATNFAEDRLRLGIDASLRRTAWAETPSQINASLGAQVVQNDAGGLVAVLDGRLRMHTSAVALANYALVEYKKRAAERAVETPPAPVDAVTPPTGATTDEIFSQLLDERLARVERLESLDDVADLMTAISGLRLTAADQRIEQLRGQARAATDPAIRQDLSQQLAAARQQRDKLFDVRPRITRGSGGAVQTIAFDMIGSEIFPGADMRQMEFRVQENDIWIQASGALTRWVELYPVVKPLVMGVLQRVQNGDPPRTRCRATVYRWSARPRPRAHHGPAVIAASCGEFARGMTSLQPGRSPDMLADE